MIIEINKRLLDYWVDGDGNHKPKYRAKIKNEPRCWGQGKSIDEAIGDLVRSHPGKFGICVEFLEGKNE